MGLIFLGQLLMLFKMPLSWRLRIRRSFCRSLHLWYNIKVDINGLKYLDPETTVIYVSNHRSLYDPVVLCGIVNAMVVSKAEVSKYPLLGTGARWTGVIYVDRSSKSSRSATVEAMRSAVLRKENVLIFPEGTTGAQKLTKEFKTGAFRIAAKEHIPVQPIALIYSDPEDHWEKRSLMEQSIYMLGKWNNKITVSVGPIMKGDSAERLLNDAQKFIDNEIEKRS